MCKSKQEVVQQQPVKKETDMNEPHILFCQLMFYKASPVPLVSMISVEAIPGYLNFIRQERGPVNYKFFNANEQILAEGNVANPLYFHAEDFDPVTGKISGHTAYLDSAFKLIRIPYIKGISSLKISFTDSLSIEHTLKLIPINIKKS